MGVHVLDFSELGPIGLPPVEHPFVPGEIETRSC